MSLRCIDATTQECRIHKSGSLQISSKICSHLSLQDGDRVRLRFTFRNQKQVLIKGVLTSGREFVIPRSVLNVFPNETLTVNVEKL